MRGNIYINRYYYDDGMKYMTERLTREFLLRGVEVKTVPTPIVKIPFDCREAADIDFIIFLNKDLNALKTLEEAGIRVFNSYYTTSLCDDKQKTLNAVKDCGVKFMQTVVSPLIYSGSALADDEEFLQETEKLGYPLIIKQCSGSQGKQVYLIKDRTALKQKICELKNIPFIAQKYFALNPGRDLRYYIAGRKVVASLSRKNTVNFKSNIYQGAENVRTETDGEHKKAAEILAEKLNMDFGSVDFFDCDEPILIEANANAYFKGVESFGLNVAAKICGHILEVLDDSRKY